MLLVHHSWMHFLFVLQLLASRLRCCGRRPNDGQVLSTREKIIVEIMCFVTNNQRWHQREQKPIFYQHSQCLTTPKKSHLSKNNSKIRFTNPQLWNLEAETLHLRLTLRPPRPFWWFSNTVLTWYFHHHFCHPNSQKFFIPIFFHVTSETILLTILIFQNVDYSSPPLLKICP